MAVIMPCHHIISPVFFALSHSHSSPLPSLSLPKNLRPAIARARARQPEQWLAELPQPDPQLDLQSEPQVGEGGGGPIELPPSSSSLPILATSDDPSPLQVATSVLLTGAITVFLFRSLRRRAKRAKELRVRSTGVTKKGLKEEALDTLKAMQSVEIDAGKRPSPIQALLGGISAGVIAIILYKFATTVEASLNRQTISDNFSVRQITITIRTIVNGLCYLATFVFGINSIGLVLYSGQLALNSFMEPSMSEPASDKQAESLLNPTSSSVDDIKSTSNNSQQSSDDTK
ncbi:hypothetical protein QJS04_geneDACA010916 [Acorus gramineus]|uniref:Transmembrane protein n=1 Tax=Acorus gramineus TaxID=55184 RepID=A0AAV9BJ96_ACOGR|nr:hypothetical protein QJS04_geneDACA010916 [Acorus gramineus]